MISPISSSSVQAPAELQPAATTPAPAPAATPSSGPVDTVQLSSQGHAAAGDRDGDGH